MLVINSTIKSFSFGLWGFGGFYGGHALKIKKEPRKIFSGPIPPSLSKTSSNISLGETILEVETYESLKKTIIINILGYIEITESSKIHTTFKIMEQEEHFSLLEDLQIHYLELPKLPRKEIEELDDVELWLDFLKESAVSNLTPSIFFS